ncbi:hypothetical protein BO70DRAFT_39475 [Aspergillus heteromorphus CBS 117.55]|uniref:Uncharacterized protein n=1 Tax=Aspergillus heteromorphus CBS 117.55 TaxID=1448321 RepID=A0A317W9W8_9EURO|nr:uncharacterized protein BO70DRAFT_39475 [Aspergillus heteromorphus CBS 117.55]PWY81788.1 hypothetical protein BO70DRAFT_39475 [Aspergillus heteromorphus CBS 117.55]
MVNGEGGWMDGGWGEGWEKEGEKRGGQRKKKRDDTSKAEQVTLMGQPRIETVFLGVEGAGGKSGSLGHGNNGCGFPDVLSLQYSLSVMDTLVVATTYFTSSMYFLAHYIRTIPPRDSHTTITVHSLSLSIIIIIIHYRDATLLGS